MRNLMNTSEKYEGMYDFDKLGSHFYGDTNCSIGMFQWVKRNINLERLARNKAFVRVKAFQYGSKSLNTYMEKFKIALNKNKIKEKDIKTKTITLDKLKIILAKVGIL